MPGIGQSGASPAPLADSLGVIITMPPGLQAELGEVRTRYATPGSPIVPAHITLISGRSTSSWQEAADHVREVAKTVKSFTISLRGTGSFEPVSPVIFLNIVKGQTECVSLHEALLEGPIEHLVGFDYQPHVTIAHDLPEQTMQQAEIEMADFSADFAVESIGLYDFHNGGWALREEISFGGKPDN